MTRKQIAARIKGLRKTGDNFTVQTNAERVTAKTEAGHMRRFELIDFSVATHDDGNGGFTVFRV